MDIVARSYDASTSNDAHVGQITDTHNFDDAATIDEEQHKRTVIAMMTLIWPSSWVVSMMVCCFNDAQQNLECGGNINKGGKGESEQITEKQWVDEWRDYTAGTSIRSIPLSYCLICLNVDISHDVVLGREGYHTFVFNVICMRFYSQSSICLLSRIWDSCADIFHCKPEQVLWVTCGGLLDDLWSSWVWVEGVLWVTCEWPVYDFETSR